MELMLPQYGSQSAHNREGNVNPFHLNNGFDAPNQALIVGHGIVQSGFCHDHIQGNIVIVKGNAAFLQLVLAVLKNSNFL